MREETEFRPKPLVEVGGRPILWHIMKLYAHHGFRDFVLCLGYRGNMIKEYFLNYEAMNNDFTICLGRESRIEYNGDHEEQNFRITLADTGLETMTGGRLKRAEKYIADDCFMVTYGDGVSDVDIRKTAGVPQEPRQLATVTTFRPVSRFGILDIDASKQVQNFIEKPQSDALGQCRVLRVPAQGLRLSRRRSSACWSKSRWSAWPRNASWSPTITTASSTPWIPIANTRS